MRVPTSIKIALHALGQNRLRSGLTALGIIIGVGAVITMVGIGNGAKAQVEAQVASLGQNVIQVSAGSSSSHSSVRLGLGSSSTLTVDDADALEREIADVVVVSPEVRITTQVVAGNRNWSTQIYGESPDYFSIRQWPLEDGAIFTEQDVRGATKVAVIGSLAAEELFGDEDPVGEIVRIKNVPFTVVGVLTSKGASASGSDQDDDIIIPYTSAMKRVIGQQTNLRRINVQAADADALEEVETQITALLRQRHHIETGKDDDFIVRDQQEIAEAATATARTMTLLLGAVAGVSLIVGGIGIMNIMLVSVVERTREIGIRLAVGARSRDILRQFLMEAFALSSIGGGIGIVLGISASECLSLVAEWPTLVSLEAVVIAFLFSAAVGIFFGFYPARKASLLDPIEALRYE
ncbi:MAG: multidrug ABC transporter substrate-binding protein [Verrucomicrobia bacterium]|nr:MAG: multidrug ABC transporter substrate-binding protein [Verrucomicrobiota bacterium]